MDTQKTLVSGVKPTGAIHIGNYFGAMRQFVDLQETYNVFVFIADYHALTTVHDAEKLEVAIRDLVAAYVAIGLDPERVTLFQQSQIPAHTELAWIFNSITPMGYLERGHAYKDARAKKQEVSVGTFDYPMLMAADILLYDADVVPVGKDQKQHLEFARDTAGKFNHLFGETFSPPEPLIIEDVATVPGTDGQKMSKSYGNTIPLFATDDEIASAVMRIQTDSKGVADPKDADDVLMQLYKLVVGEGKSDAVVKRYTEGGIGYKEMKETLIEELRAFNTPMRERYTDIRNDTETIAAHIAAGNERARAITATKMEMVRKRIGVTAFNTH